MRRGSLFAMVLGLLAAACEGDPESGPVSEQARALFGCWEGFQGDEHNEYRFAVDGHTVLLRDLDSGATYTGLYDVDANRLTLDFGEEPPTFEIEVTAETLTFVEFPFVYDRVECPSDWR